MSRGVILMLRARASRRRTIRWMQTRSPYLDSLTYPSPLVEGSGKAVQ